MTVDVNEPNISVQDGHQRTDHVVPALREDPAGPARGCLVAAAASVVGWLVLLWWVIRW